MANRTPPRIPDERFAGHEDAQYYYAMDLPVEEAVALLDRRIADGAWRRAPRDHLHLVRWLQQRKSLDWPTARRLYVAVAEAIVRGPADFAEGIQDALRIIFGGLADGPVDDDAPSALVAWLMETAGPGEARLIADIVQNTYAMAPGEAWKTPAPLRPLAGWLLRKGAAELRNPARVILLGKLAKLAISEDDDLLEPALRVLVRRPEPWGYLDDAARERLWGQLDRLLAAGASPTLALDVARCVGSHGSAHVFVPGVRLPWVRAALVGGLLRGAFEDGMARELWSWTLAGDVPDSGAVARAPLSVITFALDLLPYRLNPSFPRERLGPVEVEAARMRPSREWVSALIVAYLSGAGGVAHILADSGLRNRMLMLAGYTSATAEVFAEELRRWLLTRDPDAGNDLALELLRDGSGDIGVATAAVRALGPGRASQASSVAVVPSEFTTHLRALLHAPWDEGVYGLSFGGLLGAAREVAFLGLDGDDKVRVDGDVLQVDRGYPLLLAASPRPAEERLALLTLYVLHELVHLRQGVGAKASVGLLRETGAETALMHLDLAADHAAALLAAGGVPRWRLDWLKDLQGRALADFPVGPTHPSGSRARKAARLIGVRVDWLMRANRLVLQDRMGDGYAFAEFAAAGGPFLVLVSGPPPSLVRAHTLTAAQALVLAAAADEENAGAAGLARVDATLRAVLGVVGA